MRRLLTDQDKAALNIALNEADLLGVEVDQQNRRATATFNVLTLPEQGPMPADRRVAIVFSPVGRVVASLRNAAWNDAEAMAEPFEIDRLSDVVASFGGLSLYGWEYVDVQIETQTDWMTRLSLDWSSGDDGRAHSITLFQDASDRILDLCIWFDRLEVFDPSGKSISFKAFLDGGERWWDAFYAGDERTRRVGMAPLKGE